LTHLSKTLMIVGGIIFFIGLVMPFFHLGKLPGDIFVKKGNTTFYFPIVTCIIISIVLSLIFHFISRFR
jgi:hypothetical protein